MNARTPSASWLAKSFTPSTVILTKPLSAKYPVDIEADKSGSKSTSTQATELVVNASFATAAAIVNASEVWSLIEYPNLPEPYSPPVASVFDPEVLP